MTPLIPKHARDNPERRPGISGLVRSSLALMSSTVGSSLLGMVFWAVATWVFAPDEVGGASAGASAMLLLGALGQLALTSVFARVLPTVGPGLSRVLAGSFTLMVCATVVLTAAFVSTGLGQGFLDHRPLPVIAFGLAAAATAMSAVQDGALVALSRAGWVPIKNMALAVARLALLPLMAATGVPAPILTAWVTPVLVSVVIVNIILFGRIAPRRPTLGSALTDPPNKIEMVRLIGGQYANSVVNALVMFFPPVLVTLVLGAEANAAFFLPWTIGTAVIGLLWNIAVPFVVEATADPARTRIHLRQVMRLGLVLTVGGGAALLILAPQVLLIAGGAYSVNGTPALRLLAVALPLTGVVTFFYAAELVEMKALRSLCAKILTAVIFLGAAVPAMDAIGVTGASAAFLASQVIVGLILLGPVISRYRRLISQAEVAVQSRRLSPVSLVTAGDAAP